MTKLQKKERNSFDDLCPYTKSDLDAQDYAEGGNPSFKARHYKKALKYVLSLKPLPKSLGHRMRSAIADYYAAQDHNFY